MDEFPSRLRRLRERRGISRATMSELCGLSKSMISKYERGERQPTLEPLIELADFFEVSIDYLCGRK
jgi:transcriptional regulator with XRE-family HTH domain